MYKCMSLILILIPNSRPSLRHMSKSYKIEACVETYEEALAAQNNGADQIELCGRLDLDGITPQRTLIEKCFKNLTLDIKVMIRPRGGNFEYDSVELEQMMEDINYCHEVGVYGVVFGVLNGKSLDLEMIEKLASAASPLNVTIHKAIDDTTDIISETKKLVSISQNIDTILTSGGSSTAIEGIPNLLEMIEATKDHIEIMPAGKITNHNLATLHNQLNTTGYHGRKIVGDLTSSGN